MGQSAGILRFYCEMAEWEKGSSERNYYTTLHWSAVATMIVMITEDDDDLKPDVAAGGYCGTF